MKTSVHPRFIIVLVVLKLVCGLAFADGIQAQSPKAIFANSARRDFAPFPPTDTIELEDGQRLQLPRVYSGPIVSLGEGKEVHSAVLVCQADLIATSGADGFDEAFRYLDHKELYMRWIAVEALYRITGKQPIWYFYAKPGQTWNSDADWSDRAKVVWKKWKAEQAGTGQPATRPESKSEGGDKLQPEAEGRSR